MLKKTQFINLIRQGDFKELFISELGWNRYRGQGALPPITVDDVVYNVESIAIQKGFQILVCDVDAIPTQSLARKIDSKLRRQAADYICIYRLRGTAHHLWVVPVRTNEKRDLVLVEYENEQKADFLYSKIDGFSFEFGEDTNIVDIRAKVQGSFAVNSEKITKDFYAGFKKQHKAFADFITGIDDHIATKDNRNKQWYTSVMLNRLMFCYFIQKKGFLNLDYNYLRNKLHWVQQEQGEDRFFKSFYRGFLVELFHGGLNSPRHSREFEQMYGKIPYLNGGMFDDHQLERDYANIDIADKAFEELFDFFDTWRWHLDTRITASGKDINPDVLGYIFEQYINDRAQMGAYYTKEDITEYISRNTILPFLFDKVKAESAEAFKPDGFVWQTLRESGDRYIFDAVKHGYELFNEIPDNIRRGIITEDMRRDYSETPVSELPQGHIPLAELRSDWNTKTPEQFGLPTEIWRETIERLQRCGDIFSKIKNGEITNINDFITYNLDIRRFALDLLVSTDDTRFVKHFYKALTEVTILDPTCGSGAFLCAAMNILEPLYEVCIERMQEFQLQGRGDFKQELAEITDKYRSNIQYFIFKSIILRNLYGVDIMAEATEIAKLRLFLKMVAVVDVDHRAENLGLDPLPDVDFNIRCGNTLVGYATEADIKRDLEHPKDFLEEIANQEFQEQIEAELPKVAAAYELFKKVQLTQDEDLAAFKQAKKALRERMAKLNHILNLRQHQANGTGKFDSWLESHQPFNWIAEFYQIMHGNGGFDVIIGNPPYVTFTDKSLPYTVKGYSTYTTKNLFALCAERFRAIANQSNNIGYIIPLSGMSIDGFEPLQKVMYSNTISWNSYYSGDRNPSELFTGVKIRAGIYISTNSLQTHQKFVSRYLKFQASERSILFSKIRYVEYSEEISAPKIPSEVGRSIIKKINSFKETLISKYSNSTHIYYHAAPIHWGKSLYDLTPLVRNKLNIADSYKTLNIMSEYKEFAFSLLNSSLFFFYWIVYSDCYNLTKKYFNIGIPPVISSTFKDLAQTLSNALFEKIQIAEYTYKNRGVVRFAQFFPKQSKKIIDQIENILGEAYGLTPEEVDFIINYDIKYRMGDELSND